MGGSAPKSLIVEGEDGEEGCDHGVQIRNECPSAQISAAPRRNMRFEA